MQQLLSAALVGFLVFYVFEGLIRYGLYLAGADILIFSRDAILIVPLCLLLAQQFLQRRLHPAFIIFLAVILLHGTVMILNMGSVLAVVYSAKMLLTVLAGAMSAQTFLRPARSLVLFVLLLWAISCAGVMLDKYYMDMPWMGIETRIGDVQVELSRDWDIEGEDKRAGGFMRSSIHAATVLPLMALLLVFHLRGALSRMLVGLLTVPALVWTTQKGPIIAYLLTLCILAVMPRKPIPWLKAGVLFTMALSVALPVVLPGYAMPSAKGVFSFSSFYMRVEDMWPHAWRWIDRHEAFPFGVGLGGISGAQRLYAPDEINAADNLFILLYAFFGVMSLVYLAAAACVAMAARNDGSKLEAHALAVLVFLFGYGCVISLLEDQMASLFLGAALAGLCQEIKSRRRPYSTLPMAATAS